MSGTQACFRAFLGHGAHATPRTRADFQAFLGSLWHMVCWPWRGRRLFLGHTMVARCIGHIKDASTFLGISGLFWGHGVQAKCRTRPGRISGYGVQAMFGTRPGCCKDGALFPGISREFLGHGTQAYEGSIGCRYMKAAPIAIHVKNVGTHRLHVVHTNALRRHTK
ncbi:Hypothetical predicted protein [Olea europaea subsp. europaea]|uniref:Uncharacterized protein n=1 Tax=Olea europaea subsp. europaea TaxID=158383 RepID=A0A8S0SU32_OLEEU|nr:Hypothetical predicted protein [Olea europaea subsp. europaea]